jgi:hypothetical protein
MEMVIKMYEVDEITIITDSDYRKRCIIGGPYAKEIVFSRNSYNVIFISFGDIKSPDSYIRAIFIPYKLVDEDSPIVGDIGRVHPSTPIFYYERFDVESFVRGIIFGMLYQEVFSDNNDKIPQSQVTKFAEQCG